MSKSKLETFPGLLNEPYAHDSKLQRIRIEEIIPYPERHTFVSGLKWIDVYAQRVEEKYGLRY